MDYLAAPVMDRIALHFGGLAIFNIRNPKSLYSAAQSDPPTVAGQTDIYFL